jgi:hypothetical protein
VFGHLPTTVVDLPEDPAVVSMNQLGQSAESTDLLVAVRADLAHHAFTPWADKGVSGEDERNAAYQHGLVELEQLIGDETVIGRTRLPRGALIEPTVDCQRPDVQGRIKRNSRHGP